MSYQHSPEVEFAGVHQSPESTKICLEWQGSLPDSAGVCGGV